MVSGMSMQRFARQSEVSLAQCLVLSGVCVDQLGHLFGQCLPVVDQLGLAHLLTHPGTHHMDTDDRTAIGSDQFHKTGGPQDLGLAVAAEVVFVGGHLGELLPSLRLGETEADFEVTAGDGGTTTRLTTRLIEGEFPNYRQLIPASYPNKLTVGRDVLLEAVRRVKLMAREATPVRLSMGADGLELVAVTQDVGQASEQLDATYEGTDLTVAFNPDYLLEGIDIAIGDEVTVETLDALKPAVLRGNESAAFLYLLMPVRVS